jgi:transposase
VIRIEAVWVAVDPLDMRAGSETILARWCKCSARRSRTTPTASQTGAPAVSRSFVHDGIGVWLSARRLHQGGFVWPRPGFHTARITREQLDPLALGMPWQRIGEAGIITVL